MRSFLINSIFFLLPVVILLVVTGFLADGTTDPYYLRFTSPRQQSLIIGTSKAAQALQPEILNEELKKQYNTPIYNFSFTLDDSPFGKIYLDAIKEKIDKNAKGGLFIIAVDPWAISCNIDEQDDIHQFHENKGCLGKVDWVNMCPNFIYLARAYKENYLTILTKKLKNLLSKEKPVGYLHKDGWLEITVPMDSASKAQRLKDILKFYENHSHSTSEIRKLYLKKTIELLKEHGAVYLVRLPVHPSVLTIENKFYPEFDLFIDSVSREKQVHYINFSGKGANYEYTDGNHMWKGSGAILSKELAELIKDINE